MGLRKLCVVNLDRPYCCLGSVVVAMLDDDLVVVLFILNLNLNVE